MNELRWIKLMQAFELEDNKDTYQDLIAAYGEKHRYYHTSDHIKATLEHLDQVAHLSPRNHEIELSLWFHDAIYKPLSTDNEHESANWAVDFLSANNVSTEVINRVYKLIMATAHASGVLNNDEAMMIDIDLTILGAPLDEFNAFQSAIRKEYKLVPNFLYNRKRKEILHGFLQRKQIFHHTYFFDKFEQQARANLETAIARL